MSGTWYLVSTRTCGTSCGVPCGTTRRVHHRRYIFRLALRPSCSTILARTGECWRYSNSNASRCHGSGALGAVASCVLTLPLAGLGCPVLTRDLFMWLDPATAVLAYSTGTTFSIALDNLSGSTPLTAPDAINATSAMYLCLFAHVLYTAASPLSKNYHCCRTWCIHTRDVRCNVTLCALMRRYASSERLPLQLTKK